MPELVVMGAMLKCDKGAAPASLLVLPMNMVNGVNVPAATVMDYMPMMNIPTFGMCMATNTANPMVVSLTAAALGTPTPAPCIPVTVAPWSPGASKTTVGKAGFKALTKDSTCKCMWNGTIEVTNAGQTKIQVT